MPSEKPKAFMATARSGRPQRFDAVIGQEHITGILQGALRRGNVSHAYLFSGPRGVGKTSTARILAKALNCVKGVVEEPCNACVQCLSITGGNHMDVIEIDAASNRGIDNIRDLREAVRYSPSSARTKVYIIDEVHMLTQESFNALLKTLEEPPEHTKFILATTEEHRVPETILSRCQRFHFRRIPVVRIIDSLKGVYESQTEIDIPDAVYNYVARAARGSIRDSQSLMDQIVAFSDEEITLDDVQTLLGAVEFETLVNFVRGCHEGQLEKSLEIIEDIAQRGRDMGQFVRDLVELYRHIMVSQNSAAPEKLIDLPPEQIQLVNELARSLQADTVLRAQEILFAAEGQLRSTVDDRLVVELATFKLAKLTESVTLRQLIARVEGWEENPVPLPQSSSAKPAVNEPKNNSATSIAKDAGTNPKAQATSGSTEEPANPPVQPVTSPPPPETPEPSTQPHGDTAVLWRIFMERLHEETPKLASYLGGAQLLDFKDGQLTIAIPIQNKFEYDQLKRSGNAGQIASIAESVFGKSLAVQWELQEIQSPQTEEEAEEPQKSEPADPARLIQEAESNEKVKQVLQTFEGRVLHRSVGKERK